MKVFSTLSKASELEPQFRVIPRTQLFMGVVAFTRGEQSTYSKGRQDVTFSSSCVYTRCLNIRDTHVTTNSSTNYNIVFFWFLN